MPQQHDKQPTADSMENLIKDLKDTHHAIPMDYNDIEGFCYAAYELGQQKASNPDDEVSMMRSVLNGTVYAVLESHVRTVIDDEVGEAVIDTLLARILDSVPGLRLMIAEGINDFMMTALNGHWDPINEPQSIGVMQVCEDYFIREGNPKS